MGGLASAALSNIGLIQQGIGLVSGALKSEASSRETQRSQDLALRQMQDQQRMQAQQLAAQTALERDKIAAQSKQSETERLNALKRAVARQRANFGAQGIGGGGGSSQAVLLGLFDESEDELKARAEMDALKNRALDLGVSQHESLSLLQRSQMQERQKLDKISSVVDRADNVINTGLGALDLYKKYKFS
jgi:hypothetical protein